MGIRRERTLVGVAEYDFEATLSDRESNQKGQNLRLAPRENNPKTSGMDAGRVCWAKSITMIRQRVSQGGDESTFDCRTCLYEHE